MPRSSENALLHSVHRIDFVSDVDQTLPEKLTTFEDKAHGLVAVAVKIYDKVKLNVLDYVKSAD